jgi:hypothetical protein
MVDKANEAKIPMTELPGLGKALADVWAEIVRLTGQVPEFVEATKNETEGAADAAKKTKEHTLDLKNLLQGAALLAGLFGGTLEETVGIISSMADEFDRAATSTEKIQAVMTGIGQLGGLIAKNNAQVGGAIQGAMGGAKMGMAVGGMFGPMGAAIGGVIGGITGGIMGWVKGGKIKKAAKEAGQILGRTISNEQAKTMMEEAKKLGISVKELATKMRKEEVDAAKKQREEIIQAGMDKAIEGMKKWSGKIQGAGAEQGRIYAATFAAMVAEKGILAAADAFKDSLEEIIKISPELAAQIKKFSEPGPLRDAAEAAQGLADTLVGLAAAGYMDQSLFADFGATASAMFNQAVAGGASTKEALQAIAPTLAQMKAASEQYGFTLDANTQSLIDQAEANGIVFKTDPMLLMLEVLKEIAKVLGADIPNAANTAGNAIKNIPRPSANTGDPNIPPDENQNYGGGRREDPNTYAEGTRGWRNFGRGTPAILHNTEAVIRPGDPVLPGQVGGGRTTTVNLSINENPLQTAQSVEQMRRFTLRTAERELSKSLSTLIETGRA